MIYDDLFLSTKKSYLDVALIHQVLKKSYWCKNIPKHIVIKSIENSLCFGGYIEGQQVAFARAITDYATYAYIADVFVIDKYKGRGIGKKLMEYIIQHPELSDLRSFNLYTKDAHGLYQQFGFDVVKDGTAMKLKLFNIYK